MIDLPYESLIAVSYGLLVGFGPAVAVGLLAVGVGLAADRALPLAAGLATIPVAIGTGVAAGIFELSFAPSQGYRIATASIVAGGLGVVATSQGNRIATELPRDRAVPTVRGRTLSADAIDAVDAAGQVTIRPTGSISEFEGYPSPSPGLRTALEEDVWRVPADLPLSELERRLERRLRTDYGLSKVDVAVDGRGRASITAAPPTKGVARTLPEGTRAVTVSGLLPAGIEPGDRVAIEVGTDGNADGVTGGEDPAVEPVRGAVRAISGAGDAVAPNGSVDGAGSTVGGEPRSSLPRRRADTGFDGGRGSLTVVVETADAGRLLEADRYRIAVLPGGDANARARAVEAAALLDEAGRPITALEVPEGGAIDLDAAAPIGVRRDGSWEFAVGNENASDTAAAEPGTRTDDAAGADPPDRVFVAGAAHARAVIDR